MRNRKQPVVIEGQCSDWRTINSGVPQGSVLGPLLFLIYINDITDDLASLPLIYADDTTLLEIVDDTAVSAGRLNSDLNKIAVWLVTMNPVKSRNVVFSLKRNKQVHPPLFLNSNKVKDAESHTHLGLTLQSSMSWRNHIVQVYEKASKRFINDLPNVLTKCRILMYAEDTVMYFSAADSQVIANTLTNELLLHGK